MKLLLAVVLVAKVQAQAGTAEVALEDSYRVMLY
jgi:hypothetical protein